MTLPCRRGVGRSHRASAPPRSGQGASRLSGGVGSTVTGYLEQQGLPTARHPPAPVPLRTRECQLSARDCKRYKAVAPSAPRRADLAAPDEGQCVESFPPFRSRCEEADRQLWRAGRAAQCRSERGKHANGSKAPPTTWSFSTPRQSLRPRRPLRTCSTPLRARRRVHEEIESSLCAPKRAA